MHYAEFAYRLETWLVSAIRSCYPSSWDENQITLSIADKFTGCAETVSLDGLDRPFKLVWDARTLQRPDDTLIGDIAVLVNLTTWAGETLEGVGFLQAKRRDQSANTFSSAKTRQLRKIVRKAPSARLLLYDYDNVSACMDNWVAAIADYSYHRGLAPSYTHCVSVPAATAFRRGCYTTELHKFGVPLAFQLVARYFRGFDLELAEELVEATKGNIDADVAARTLIMVGVSTGEGDPALPQVNGNRYERPR
jgi:hypothetical protein